MADITKILGGPFQPPSQNQLSPQDQLRAQMMSNDITPPDSFEFDGKMHRFSTRPGDSTDTAGWYVIFGDNIPAGTFGCWRAGTNINFSAKVARPISAAEQMQINKRIQEARNKRTEEEKRKHEIASDVVTEIWNNSMLASENHAYLQKKGIKPNGARVTNDGRLILPLYDANGELSSVQYIDQDGKKLYHSGGAVKSAFFVLGDYKEDQEIFVCEGFATGATIYEETQRQTYIAYSANNLEPVTGYIKSLYPASHVIVVADNDKSGTGENYANQASAKHGASVIVCPVESDMNDYRLQGGDVAGLLLSTTNDIFDRLKVVSGSDIGTEYTPPDEIIQSLLVANSNTVIYGDSNSGKTFWAISMAAAVSDGTKFHGRMVDQGVVVYLATESPGTVRERMQAYKRFFQSELKHFYMVSVPVNFYESQGDANSIIELCKTIEAKTHKPIRMIIGDTLARISSGANENSGEDMGPVMARFDDIALATGASMVIIHHNGKDQAKGARGWSGIRAHIDTEIEITDNKGIKCATITKDRSLGVKGHELYFKLEVIEMGIGKFGDEKSTCVAIPDLDAQAKEGEKESAKNNQDLSILKRAWFASGAEIIDGSPYISTSALKDYLMKNKIVTSESTLSQAVKVSAKNYFIGKLYAQDLVEKHSHGFIVCDPALASSWILTMES